MNPSSDTHSRFVTFAGTESVGWSIFCVAAVVLAGILIVLLLRHERRLVSRSTGWLLLAFRLAVLAVLLLMFLQPVMGWKLNREVAGRIVVAVDVSESMSTPDETGSDLEKFRWARTLGLVQQSDDLLDAWDSALAMGEEPDWATEPDKAALRAEEFAKLVDDVGKWTRLERIQQLLQGNGRFFGQLAAQGRVDVVAVGRDVRSVDADTLNSGTSLSEFGNNREASNLAAVLEDTEVGAPLRGIVLLTDGRDNGGSDPVSAARRLGSSDVPVFPVAVGSRSVPRDLSIASADYPPTIFKDDRLVIEAVIKTAGFEKIPINIVLEYDGEIIESRTVTPSGQETDVEFGVDLAGIGRRNLVLRAEPQKGETRIDNNAMSLAVKIVDDTARVLLVDGEAGWEFRFLHNALDRDERVELTSVVFRQPYLGRLDKPYFADRLGTPVGEGAEPVPLFDDFDLVILGDVPPRDMPEDVWNELEEYVFNIGGSLVLIAGHNFMPDGHSSATLNKLLPVRRPVAVNMIEQSQGGSPLRRGLKLRLTADGENATLFQFDTDRQRNRRIWNELPGHMWAMVGEPKPGTTVFANAYSAGGRQFGQRRTAAIVHRNFGFGQVLWMGVNSTWRWRHRVGDRYHHRFWGQLGRWAAENKASAGNEFVRFVASPTEIAEGETARFEARWTSGFLAKHPNPQTQVTLYRDASDTAFATIPLKPQPDRPLVFDGRAVSLPSGSYRAVLSADEIELGSIETEVFVAEPTSVELSDLSCNRELLNEIAEASGGRMLEIHELHELKHAFSPVTSESESLSEIELWDHWSLMCTAFAFMMAGWVTRKLNGLP